MLRPLSISLLLPLMALLGLGCIQTVQGESYPALRERERPIRRIAVAPARLAEGLSETRLPAIAREEESGASPRVGAELLGAHFTELLEARGVEVIPPGEVGRALEVAELNGRLVPRRTAEVVGHELGADALLVVNLHRYVQRKGGAAGATRGASVGFHVDLFDVPSGARLWSGRVDETQRPLNENVLDASRLPGGGSRWLTAEELLRWAAEQTAAQIPLL